MNQELNLYILLALNGFFSGFGIMIGQKVGKIFYDRYMKRIKDRIKWKKG